MTKMLKERKESSSGSTECSEKHRREVRRGIPKLSPAGSGSSRNQQRVEELKACPQRNGRIVGEAEVWRSSRVEERA